MLPILRQLMPLDRVAWAALSAERAWARDDSSMATGGKQEMNYASYSPKKAPERVRRRQQHGSGTMNRRVSSAIVMPTPHEVMGQRLDADVREGMNVHRVPQSLNPTYQ